MTLLVWFGVQAGVLVVLFPFFQAVLGWSGLLATLGLMPMAILMMVSSALAAKVAKAIGHRLTMALGMVLGGSGLALHGWPRWNARALNVRVRRYSHFGGRRRRTS